MINLDETFELETPENIVLTYTLAGIGSRFAAILLDTVLWITLLIANSLLFILILAPQASRISNAAENALLAIWAILNLALFWGYFIGFELFWNGQTPGKRLLNIRVLRATGYPVTFSDVLIRNLVRAIDFLPGFYGAGIISMLLTRRAERLGDLAAGTVVVKDQKRITLDELGIATSQPETIQTQPVVAALPQPATLPNIERLRPEDYIAVRAFFERAARNDLPAATITAIGNRMARALATRLEYRGSLITDTQCAQFLREVLLHERFR